MITKDKQKQRGFTLVEMMVALLISGIVVAPFFIITRGVSEETTKQQMETEAIQRARIGLQMLTSDLQRAGMMTSPNPSADPDSMVSQGSARSQHAYFRPAVIHLNRDGTDKFDSILLVGNFITANTYMAHVYSDEIVIDDPIERSQDAIDEFNSDYSFVHLYSTTGQTLDAKVNDADDAVTCVDHPLESSGKQCSVDLLPGELFMSGPGAFAEGQQISVAANQAVLYRVEPVSGHNVLMRYFVDFDGASSMGVDCAIDDIKGSIVASTGKVIAEYVEDFQVWFRTAYRRTASSTTEPQKVMYHDLSTLATNKIPFVPGNNNAVIGRTTPGSAVSTDALSCEPPAGMLAAQHARTALVQLSVRTEKTDMSMEMSAADIGKGIVKYNVAAAPSGDVGLYKVRTLFAEAVLTNIMARMPSFNGANDVPSSFQ